MNKISQISHVIFSGGGIKGMSYLGILRYFYIENMMDDIKNVSGSSIGAYFSLLLALRMPIDQIESDLIDVLSDINDKQVLDITKDKFANIFNKLGFNTVNFMMKPIIQFILKKYGDSDITFIELVKKTGVNIYISTTNINTGCGKIFSAENTPNSSVVLAVLASMAVPFLFEPVLIEDQLYVDGLLSCDLPIEIFKGVNKKNMIAVILYPSEKEELSVSKKECNFIEYSLRISSILITTVLRQYSNKYKNNKKEHILKMVDMPYDQAFKFKITDNTVKLELTQEDIDNLILKGFIDVSNHMNARYKDYIISNV